MYQVDAWRPNAPAAARTFAAGSYVVDLAQPGEVEGVGSSADLGVQVDITVVHRPAIHP